MTYSHTLLYFLFIWSLLIPLVHASEPQKYKKPAVENLKKKLTPEQFDVTQKNSTEKPFQNRYWNHKEVGIYVDVVTGEPLFSSEDKYDSGTGWPSFKKPIDKSMIQTKQDNSLFTEDRVEVRSKHGDSHLGHVFKDGPGPDGNRFCINSASLRFVPLDKMEQEGYKEYLSLFKGVSKLKTDYALATLAGGCFWGVEELIRKLAGVIETEVGYTGGKADSPIYEVVKKGQTGHAEAIQIKFDPKKISYEEILNYFFRLHDPTTLNRQGNDIGTQYRSAIFYHDDEQKKIAEKVKDRVDKSGKWKSKVVTEIVPASKFYPAEGYHQDYLQKNPGGYTCHFLRE